MQSNYWKFLMTIEKHFVLFETICIFGSGFILEQNLKDFFFQLLWNENTEIFKVNFY